MTASTAVRPWWMKLFGCWATRTPRQLRLCETLALGDRQFLSVVEFGAQTFLIGRTSSSVALVAQISGPAGEGQARYPGSCGSPTAGQMSREP